MDDTAIIAMSCQPALLVKYLETYLGDQEGWLRERRIAINVLKSSAMFFVKAGRCIPKPQPVQLLGEQIQWVDTACYLGVNLDAPAHQVNSYRSGEKREQHRNWECWDLS
jgi:hypothetical protein